MAKLRCVSNGEGEAGRQRRGVGTKGRGCGEMMILRDSVLSEEHADSGVR